MLEKQRNTLNKKRELLKVKKIQNELNKNDCIWFMVAGFFSGMSREKIDLSIYLEKYQIEISEYENNDYIVELTIEYTIEEETVELTERTKKIQVVIEEYSDDFKEAVLILILDEIENIGEW